MAQEFNGYRSWNCWNVCLWINNVEDIYRNACECLEKAKKRFPIREGMSEKDLVERRSKVIGYATTQFMLDVPPFERTPDGAKYSRIAVKTAMDEILGEEAA